MKVDIKKFLRFLLGTINSISIFGRANVALLANVCLDPACRIFVQPLIKTAAGAEIKWGSEGVPKSNPRGYNASISFLVTHLVDNITSSISLGERCRLHGCSIHAWSQIKIGHHCFFADGGQVLDAHGHATELQLARLRNRIKDRPEPIEIGDYFWLGLGALILMGIQLGEGSIVVAISVVLAGNYPPFSLVVGFSAKVISQIKAEELYPEDYPVEMMVIDGKRVFDS